MGKKQKKKQKAKAANRMRRIGMLFIVASTVSAVGVLAFLGWRWQANLAFQGIKITGAQFADTTEVASLAGIEVDTMLFDLDPALIEDRVVRHPWVQEANVTRLFSGTLRIAIDERTPVALLLDGNGRPNYFLDAEGYRMPLAKDAVFDVPLIRGFSEAYHPVRPIQNPSMQALLATLATIDLDTDALVSEFTFESNGEVVMHTAPTLQGHSIPVRLGRVDFAEKLGRLHAFWHQAILAKQDTQFDLIDLRFSSQIVTRERQTPSKG